MKKTMLLMLFPLLLMVVLLWAEPKQFIAPTTATTSSASTSAATVPATAAPVVSSGSVSVDSSKDIVSYAMSLLGSPYVYAGITPEGFDCSGFITHVYSEFDIEVPHSSAMQAEEGTHVAREDAKVGDLVIFTGTNLDVREPGHVGIVISSPGDTIEFVHASSNGGVKVSKVEGTRYDLRFLQVRRIL